MLVSVPTISKVHDAYIIAVEESARRKLEDASANHRVVPVDMTKSPPPHVEEEAITAFRAEPVSAVLGSEAGPREQSQISQQSSYPSRQQQELIPLHTAKSPSVSPTKPPRQLVPQQKPAPQQLQSQGREERDPSPRAAEDPLVEQNPVHASSMPASEKRGKASPAKHGGLNGSVEALEMNGMMMTEKERDSPRKSKGSKGKRTSTAASNPDTPLIEDMLTQGGLAPNGKTSSHNSLSVSSQDVSMYDMDADPGFDHSQHDSVDSDGPHREMAIDCPDSFVATVKTPPRYPPPQNPTVPRVPPTTPSRTADSVKDKARTEATLNDAAMVVAGGAQPKPTTDQLERLRKHQEELRKRREEENRQQQEQDFLRTSLRGSKKLQALENKRMAQTQQLPTSIGIINTAFVDAEDDEDEDEGELVDDVDAGQSSQAVPVERYLKKNAGQ